MMGNWVAVVVTAMVIAGCGSSGVSPKAFGTEAGNFQPAPAVESGLDKSVAEPVVVTPEVIEGFRFLYRFITEVEFVLCLEGTRRNGRLYLEGFRLARMEATSVNSVNPTTRSSRSDTPARRRPSRSSIPRRLASRRGRPARARCWRSGWPRRT